MLAHALFPQIPQGLIPVIVKECGESSPDDWSSSAWISCLSCCSLSLRLGFAVRMVKDIHQLPDNIAEAVHKPRILAFQLCNSLLFLRR